jgi:hypothetical protein
MPFHSSGHEVQESPRPTSCCQNNRNKNILEILITVSSHGKVGPIWQDVSHLQAQSGKCCKPVSGQNGFSTTEIGKDAVL